MADDAAEDGLSAGFVAGLRFTAILTPAARAAAERGMASRLTAQGFYLRSALALLTFDDAGLTAAVRPEVDAMLALWEGMEDCRRGLADADALLGSAAARLLVALQRAAAEMA